METNEQVRPLTPEEEVAQAQALLNVARAKRAAAAELKEQQARAELAAYQAKEAAQIVAAAKAQEEFQQKILKRKKKEAEAEAEKIRIENEHQKELEQATAKAEAERQVIVAHNDNLKRLTELAHQEEQEAQQLINDALAAAARANELREQTGVTINPTDEYYTHPLRRFLSVNDICAPDKPTAQSAVNSAPPLSSRKTHPIEDRSLSVEVEDMIRRELKINANRTTLDRLASIFNGAVLVEATRAAIEVCKATPISHDTLLQIIEQYADRPIVGASNG